MLLSQTFVSLQMRNRLISLHPENYNNLLVKSTEVIIRAVKSDFFLSLQIRNRLISLHPENYNNLKIIETSILSVTLDEGSCADEVEVNIYFGQEFTTTNYFMTIKIIGKSTLRH